jgi:hypothetical protein
LEYSNHCGSGHTLLLRPATIPENGVELGCVIGLLITEGNEAILTKDVQNDDTHTPWPGTLHNVKEQYVGTVHTPYLGTSTHTEQQMHGIYCVKLGTSVQPLDITADLEKVPVNSASRNLDRTPGMVDGREERFCDIGQMIKQWEKLENDDGEWKVEEGVRRGGRKLSKRMSEHLGIYGGKGEKASVTDWESGGELKEDNLTSLSLVTLLLLPSSNDTLS